MDVVVMAQGSIQYVLKMKKGGIPVEPVFTIKGRKKNPIPVCLAFGRVKGASSISLSIDSGP